MLGSEIQKLIDHSVEVLTPLSDYAKNCHAASLALVRAGIGTRVARGFCRGVSSQHSWVSTSINCYDATSLIIDPTLWSHQGADTEPYIWIGTLKSEPTHRPHGSGSIWTYGRPQDPTGPIIKLKPNLILSTEAKQFLKLLGPLDREGWQVLSGSPVGGWPAREIFAAMDDTPELSAMVPIDIIGMVTDRNPGNLYF